MTTATPPPSLTRPPDAAYRTAYDLHLRIGGVYDFDVLVGLIPSALREILGCETAALLHSGIEPGKLSLVSMATPTGNQRFENVFIELADGDVVGAWRRQEGAIIDPKKLDEGSMLRAIFSTLPVQVTLSATASAGGIMYGVLLAQDAADKPPTPERLAVFSTLGRTVGIALSNAWRYQRTEEDRDRRADEMNMLAQIDRELSDSISLNSAFALTLDWAMRYTVAHAAYLSLFDEATGVLRPVSSLGYEKAPETVVKLFESGGIPQRVALNNNPEIVPDVSLDNDHVPLNIAFQSHLSVPVTREDRVIAVISLESRRLNAFTDAHIDFVLKLCARAGIAIDNARLYAEAVREREQTISIVREIADVVIVVGKDERILLINPSAISVMRLYHDQRYVGRKFADIFEDHPLLPLFKRATASGRTFNDQLTLPGDRPYAASFTPHPDIGWIITLHDLTELRQADQIKRDFIAILSHDLKQPISVIKGYTELLEMQNLNLNERSIRYLGMIFHSLENMRKLIDDMLDLARLDSGLDISHDKVPTAKLVNVVHDWIRPAAEAKSMKVIVGSLDDLPALIGDESRLTQILVNLVHNAVKYTPPDGTVRIEAERIGDSVRFTVKDNGIGISPDDQKAIFDRFFRVRRPETENIEGSGVGLALVKKLVDMHNGQIGVESRLGEGTTFYLTLPIWKN